jgi:hypothetical protein
MPVRSLSYLTKSGGVDWTDDDSRLEIDRMMAQRVELYRSRANVEAPCVTA